MTDCMSSKVVDLTDIEKLSLHTITLLLINLPAIQVHMARVNNELLQPYFRSLTTTTFMRPCG